MTDVLPKPSLGISRLGKLSVLTDEALFAACGVRIAFTGREGGVSTGPYASLNTASHVGDDLACVQRNCLIVLDALGFPEASLVMPNQVHGTDIVRVDSACNAVPAAEKAKEGADAIVVEAPGVAALLNFADCLPLIIVAPSGRFAVVHAGWRGALAGIAGKAARFLEECGNGVDSAAQFNAYIGPHIRQECFETSEEIATQFIDAYGADVLVDSRHINLSRAVAVDLTRAGMNVERIADAGLCTVCNSDRYFSYRVSSVCGRHAAVAVRKES